MAGLLMSLPPSFFYGPHRSDGWWRAQSGNRQIVESSCGPITVTAAELAEAVREDGVDRTAAVALVERLITRAHEEAIARMLGI